MVSVAEVEIGGRYMNAQENLPIRTCLEEMGHSQPPTPIQVDNTIIVGFVNKIIKQKKIKINWHEDLLDTRQVQSRAIYHILSPWCPTIWQIITHNITHLLI